MTPEKTLRVGIPIIGYKNWMGGISYIELLVKALCALPEPERPELYLILTDDSLPRLELHEAILHLFKEIIFVGDYRREYPNFIYAGSHRELLETLDFYFPVMNGAWPTAKAASWIPDFQHLHLPQFFSGEEQQYRSENFATIAAQAKLLVFSSQDAQNDFERFYPGSEAVTRVLSFYALPHDEWYSADCHEVQTRYGLPDAYLICCNQFWTHKNHVMLFQAVAQLHAEGIDVHLVCTGPTEDYRTPGYFEAIQELVASLGVGHLIHILGSIPRQDQIQLVRRAMALVQPSLFEGWSTVIEDCRVLGKIMILSDLPVHREQAPRHGVYFNRTSLESLTAKLREMLPQLSPGPREDHEREARDAAPALVQSFARRFCSIARDALRLSAPPANLQAAPPWATAPGSPHPVPAEPVPQQSRTTGYLVSAIVSSYNAERFLRGKLEDLEAQTIAGDLEIIVIDSGSQQDERSIVEEFQRRYDNIRYLRTEQRETVYQAWNRGIRMASGEFVTNSNTDDRLRRDALETLVRALREHPECVLAYPDMRITQQENVTFEAHQPFGFRDWPPYDRTALLELCCIGPFPLWRRSLHEEIGYFDERYKSAADYEFWLRASQSHEFIHVPQFLGLYWLSDDTVSRQGDLPTLEYLQVQKEYRARFAPFAPGSEALSPAEAARFQALVGRVRSLDASPTAAAPLTEAAGSQDAPFQELERFAELHPGFPEAHHELAQLYYKQGEIGPAKKHFEKAVILDPSAQQFADSLQGFIRLELYQSLQHHTAQIALHPEKLEHRLCAGMILILLERFESAQAQYREALAIDPNSTLARENLAALERLATKVPIPPSPPAGEERATAPQPSNEPDAHDAPGYYAFSRPEVQRQVSRRAKRILDVGCAEGRVSAGLKGRQGAEVWGIECNPEAAAAAAGQLARVLEAPVEQALAQLPQGHFDSIILADVLEHLVDPSAVLADLTGKLSPNGEMVVSLPNVGHWSVLQGLLQGSWEYQDAGILDRTHLKFFTRRSALALFVAAGLCATSVTPIALAGDAGMPERLLLALQQGGVAGPELVQESSAYQYLFRLVRSDALMTSIVILTYNEMECTRECLESIARNTPEPHEIILVDNGSSDATLPYLRELCAGDGRYRLLENGENFGFAAGCNLGMRLARGGRILLLNNDVVVTRGWLGGMLACLEREPGAAIVGPMSNEVAGPQRVADTGYRTTEELEEFARSFRRANDGRRIRVPRLVGFCMMFYRELLESIGDLDQSFGSGNFEDDDFCLRAALAGSGCVIAADVFIHHYGSRSFKANGIDYARAMATNRAVYDAKWELGRLDEALAKQVVTRNATTGGRRLARQGRLGEAVDLLLQQGIRFSPASREPYLALAEILVDAGSFQNALEVLEQLPGDEQLADLLLAAVCQRGLGHPARAQELAGRALRLDPDAAGVLHLKGSLELDRGEPKAAEAHFRAGIEADPGFGPCYTALAELAWERGDRSEGMELAELGFALAPQNMVALTHFHNFAVASGALPREEQRVREARALFPEHKGLAFGLIEILIRRGALPEAMAQIGQAAVDFGMDDAMIDAALTVRDRIGPLTAAGGARSTISLCMIVKDEGRHLPALLLSVLPLVDEIIVVDTGSSDRSADIARVFGARLFSFPWNGSFADARNFSLRQASCDWILVLDADEVLAAVDLFPLRALLERTAAPTAFSFTTRNYIHEITRKNWTANAGEYPGEERGCGWTPSDKVRLFPNDDRLRFEGAVHELLERSLIACAIPIHACDVPVHHYGKLDQDKNLQKQEQYYLLGLKKLAEAGEEAASLAELALQATELERFQEAEGLWHRLLLARPESAEAYFNLGYLHLVTGRFSQAREHALRATALAPGMKEAAFNLAKCELFLGNVQGALSGSQSLLESWPDYPPALSLYCVSSLILGLNVQGDATLERLSRMGFDCADYLREYADGLRKGDRHDLAAPLMNLAGRVGAVGAPIPMAPRAVGGNHARC